MKIAILSHLKFPIREPFAGGLERHTHLLAQKLRQRGHSVTVFASAGSDPALKPIALCKPTGDSHGDPVRAARIDRAEQEAYLRMMRQVSRGGFDIVHNNSLHVIPLLARPLRRARMVTMLHTPPFRPFADGMQAFIGKGPVVAVSDSLARQWRDIVPDIAVIGNGIDLQALPFIQLPGPERHAFWSGRIVPEKGLHLAIDAARMAGLTLRFAGPRQNVAYWEAEIAPRLGPGIVDLGHLEQAALAREIGGARVVLVSPRWAEPFGLVVAEALACGTPVAGFRMGALPRLLTSQTGRLAEPDSVEDLARAALEATMLDRRACRARAEQEFDAERMLDDYETLYTQVTTPPRRVQRSRLGLDMAEAR